MSEHLSAVDRSKMALALLEEIDRVRRAKGRRSEALEDLGWWLFEHHRDIYAAIRPLGPSEKGDGHG